MHSLIQGTEDALVCQVKQKSKTQQHESSDTAVCIPGAASGIAELAYTTMTAHSHRVHNYGNERSAPEPDDCCELSETKDGAASTACIDRKRLKTAGKLPKIGFADKKRLKSRLITDEPTAADCVVLYLRG